MQNLDLAIIIPVYNDWDGLSNLILDLDFQLARIQSIGSSSLFIVDDASNSIEPLYFSDKLTRIQRLEVIRLGCNLGHQRAIAIGLSDVISRASFDVFLIMDSDGEDSPSDVIKLFNTWHRNPDSVVVARRSGRHEGPLFIVFYQIYLFLFQFLSGRRLDFGNFAVLSSSSVRRLVYMPELWNHFAASILRSRLPLVGVLITKGKRLHGSSRMNFVSLVNHGLSAASVLIDIVFVRLLIISTAVAVCLIVAALHVFYQKFFTTFAIPGWASSMIGLSLLGLIQLFGLIFVVFFLVLSNRSTFQRPTIYQAKEYIESIVVYED